MTPREHAPADEGESRATVRRHPRTYAPSSSRPRISIIFPTYQRRELIVTNVKALEQQEFDGEFEVIVVVDGSTDGTAAALRSLDVSFPLRVVEQPNAGSAAARNHGASLARGELLLFLDDDMEAHPRLLAEHDRSHRTGAAAVMGHIPLHPGSPRNLVAEGVGAWAEHRTRRLSEKGALLQLEDMLTGQLSVERGLFQRLEGFDTRFRQRATSGNADTDFGLRLLESGSNVVFNASAISWQKYVVTPRQFLRQWREVGRADVRFARKHPEMLGSVFTEKKLKRRRWWLVPPLAFPVRWVLLRRLDRGDRDRRTRRWFDRLRWYEYWRGVAEAGGIPRG